MTSRLVVSVPTDRLAADLGPLPDDVEVVVWGMTDSAPRDRFDIVVTPYLSAQEVFPWLEGIEVGLVQSQAIGWEGIAEHLPAGLRLANAATVHEPSTAELAVGLAIAAQREIPRFVRAAQSGSWEQSFTRSLADRRVTLLGFGGVGKAIAARLEAFEVELNAVASRARVENGVTVHAVSDLHVVLAETEVLIASLPGSDETRHLLDATALAALPDGALIVNVGRGPLIDTDALVAEVSRGRLRVALDVVDPEPLPADHPLWTLPGSLVVPHVGGTTSAMFPRIARLVRRQIERMLKGEEPENVVIAG